MKAKVFSVLMVLIGGGLTAVGSELFDHYIFGGGVDRATDKLKSVAKKEVEAK